MRNLCLLLALFSALPAQAADCYADYKAKQDNPLRLHYGVIELHEGCTPDTAKDEIATRLSDNDWTLLNIVSIFGTDDLDARKESAGPYYLRF